MAMNTLGELLSTLKSSIDTASASLCEPDQLQPPVSGISLLDTKNELFLSYLQNLVFLIVLKLRQARKSIEEPSAEDDEDNASTELRDNIVGKLVELRVYLEKGVKPLESRLRYQIDKVIRAADDAALKSAGEKLSLNGKKGKASTKTNGTIGHHGSNDSESGDSSEDEDDNEDDEEEIDPLSYRPNPAAFAKAGADSGSKTGAEASDGIYRPPRITATAMPRPTRIEDLDKRTRSAKVQRSATLDEFVASEMSAAPVAEPSIGTTIRAGGRRNADARERAEQREREAYEESHFLRLPKESKTDRRKKDKGRRARDGGWGGEEWRDIERGADRLIGALDKNRDRGAGNKVRAALERSRKRTRDDAGGAGAGARMGEAFERRKHNFEKQTKRRKTR